MVIQTSQVAMGAETVSHTLKQRTVSYTGWGELMDGALQADTSTPRATDSRQTEKETMNAEEQTEYASIRDILRSISQNGIKEKKISSYDLFLQLMGIYRERLNCIMQNLGRSSGTNTNYNRNNNLQTADAYSQFSVREYSYESEEMMFSSVGRVVTADGRDIDFDICAVMSRSFEKYADVNLVFDTTRYIDPLVINLEGAGVSATDKTFLFDIDADGQEDNLAVLAETCGFLALDRNGDGIINDGSELFGAATGDGFKELAVFDLDGNGWIDENDEIFNHLRIWSKDSEGNDRLVALGVAGIGAIYLGNVNSPFSVSDAAGENNCGKIRSTGIFLKENGTAGTIQHFDYAV